MKTRPFHSDLSLLPWRHYRYWLSLWLIIIGLLALSSGLKGLSWGLLLFWGLELFRLLMFSLFQASTRLLSILALIILSLIGLYGLAERYVLASSWQVYEPFQQVIHNEWGMGGFKTYFEPSPSQDFLVERYWRIFPNTEDLSLRFKVQALNNIAAWDWLSIAEQDHLSYQLEDDTVISQWQPSSPQAFIYQAFDSPVPLATKQFQMSFSARAKTAQCGKSIFALKNNEFIKASDLCLEEAWQDFKVIWQIPPETQEQRLSFLVQGFEGLVEFKGVRLERDVKGDWQEVGGLEPQGLYLEISWDNMLKEGLTPISWRIMPQEQEGLQDAEMVFSNSSLVRAKRVMVRLKLERGLSLELSDVKLTSSQSSQSPWQQPRQMIDGARDYRQAFFLAHPNLAGTASPCWPCWH
ncbi:MAG: hypothetical protein R2880_07745 [Deinococcales bacterium]